MAKLSGKTYDVQFDYKYQTTDLGIGAPPFTSKTLIGAADFNIPLKMFSPVVWSAAFEQTQSTGSEYVLNNGNPPSLGEYVFYAADPPPPFTYEPLNITEQTWAFGVKYPLSNLIHIRMDCLISNYNWIDAMTQTHNRNDEIWRFTYEAHF